MNKNFRIYTNYGLPSQPLNFINRTPFKYPRPTNFGKEKVMNEFIEKLKESLTDYEEIKDLHIDYNTDQIKFIYANNRTPDIWYSWGCTMEFAEELEDFDWFADMIRNKWLTTWQDVVLSTMDNHTLILLHIQKYQQLQQLDITNPKIKQNKRLIQLKIKWIDKEIHQRAKNKNVSDRVFRQWYMKEGV